MSIKQSKSKARGAEWLREQLTKRGVTVTPGYVNDSTIPKPFRINEWPEGERPAYRLREQGPASLSDAELLSLFLTTPKREDAVTVARRILADAGGIRDLLDLPIGTMAKVVGCTLRTATILKAALELGTRHIGQQLQRGDALSDPDQAGQYFARKLRHLPHEVFACLFLDSRHRVLAYEELFRGTFDGSEVHPREVARRCLAHNATTVIFGHNHPSGNPEASAADRAVTARLKQALALVEVRVLDHFIVGDGEPTSFARRGWM